MSRPVSTSWTILFLSVVLAGTLAPAAAAYEIGHTAITWNDPARAGRAVPCEVYYPGVVAGENVPVAGEPGVRFPAVSFGHGFVMTWDLYSFLWEALVPAGYIVVLPRTEGSFSPSHLNLGRDLAFAIASMQAEGAAPASRFHQKVAATSAIGGHSMGGGASVLAAAEGAGPTALFNLAAAETNPSAIAAAASVEAPALMFAGSRDCVTPPAQHQRPIYDSLASSCRTLIEITGASHCQFANSSFLCGLGEGGCQPPTISRAAQHAMVISFLRPWLDYQLKGDAAAWSLYRDLLAGGAGFTAQDDCSFTSVAAPAAGDGFAGGGARLLIVPNPFTGTTRVAFAGAGRPDGGELAIFDVHGRRVRVLRAMPAGGGVFEWDGRDDQGRALAPGLYRIRSGIAGDDAGSGGTVLLLR